MTWFWLNIPLALLFVCGWAGIPLWHTCRRWNAELTAKHAVAAAKTVAAPVPEQPGPPALEETGRPARAGVAGRPGR
jgi:hypothetical protein